MAGEVILQPCEEVGLERGRFGASEISSTWEKKFQEFDSLRTTRSLIYRTTSTSLLSFLLCNYNTDKMSAEDSTANGATPGERVAIGISFGNSNSSIAVTSIDDKAEVIANEDGGISFLGIM